MSYIDVFVNFLVVVKVVFVKDVLLFIQTSSSLYPLHRRILLLVKYFTDRQ